MDSEDMHPRNCRYLATNARGSNLEGMPGVGLCSRCGYTGNNYMGCAVQRMNRHAESEVLSARLLVKL